MAADDVECRLISRKYGVQALCFLSRIATVVIAHQPLVGMTGLSQTAPAPEITACKTATTRCIAHNE